MIEHIEMPGAREPHEHSVQYHHKVHGLSDRVAYAFVAFAAFFADLFFAGRYGSRAVVLETIAAVPGMVGGLLQHLKALRWFRDDHGWIKTLLDEAENERMHLMIFVHVTKPTLLERILVMVVQLIFYNVYFLIYLFSSRTAHRIVGYLEEKAVQSYTEYLAEVEANPKKNIPAPELAIKYWMMDKDARLSDVIKCVREDEMHHRDMNHQFSNSLR